MKGIIKKAKARKKSETFGISDKRWNYLHRYVWDRTMGRIKQAFENNEKELGIDFVELIDDVMNNQVNTIEEAICASMIIGNLEEQVSNLHERMDEVSELKGNLAKLKGLIDGIGKFAGYDKREASESGDSPFERLMAMKKSKTIN